MIETPTDSPVVFLDEAKDIVAARAPAGASFNPVALLVRREIDLSRVLGWLLDPHGNHGEGDAFLRSFLAMVGIAPFADAGTVRTRLEVPRYKSGRLVGRIDIEIAGGSFLLLVENKPVAGFGNRQVERYLASLSRETKREARLAVLLGAGWSESGIAAIRLKGAVVLKLGEEVQSWVGQCSEICRDEHVGRFLRQLSSELERRYGDGGEQVSRDLIDHIMSDPQRVKAAVAISDAQYALTTRMNGLFQELVIAWAKAEGLSGIRPTDFEYPLFGGNRYGVLRLDIGDARYDFAIQADKTNFQQIAVGVCLRKENKGLARTYASEVGKLQEALGHGDAEEADGWWLWWEWATTMDLGGARTADRASIWGWAADPSDDGLAALFVRRAAEAKRAIQGGGVSSVESE